MADLSGRRSRGAQNPKGPVCSHPHAQSPPDTCIQGGQSGTQGCSLQAPASPPFLTPLPHNQPSTRNDNLALTAFHTLLIYNQAVWVLTRSTLLMAHSMTHSGTSCCCCNTPRDMYPSQPVRDAGTYNASTNRNPISYPTHLQRDTHSLMRLPVCKDLHGMSLQPHLSPCNLSPCNQLPP